MATSPHEGLYFPTTQVLASTGMGTGEAFWRVAQAVSETLPVQSKEKKLLDGFLAGRERVRQRVSQQTY